VYEQVTETMAEDAADPVAVRFGRRSVEVDHRPRRKAKRPATEAPGQTWCRRAVVAELRLEAKGHGDIAVSPPNAENITLVPTAKSDSWRDHDAREPDWTRGFSHVAYRRFV
jgi:hypothetical protein